MNKSLEFVKQITEKYNKSVIADDASWSVIEYPAQVKKDEIVIRGDDIVAQFDFKETGTSIEAVIRYDPEADFKSVVSKGKELNKFPNLETAKRELSIEVLNYFLKGEWVSDKTVSLGAPMSANFRVGDFICVRQDYEDKPIMLMLLPVTLDFKLKEEEYKERWE